MSARRPVLHQPIMKSKKQHNVFRLTRAGLVGGFLAAALVAAASDPLDDVKRFSDFPATDLRHVIDGEILGARGSLLNFPNGLSAQTCFVTPEAAAETVRRWRSPREPTASFTARSCFRKSRRWSAAFKMT